MARRPDKTDHQTTLSDSRSVLELLEAIGLDSSEIEHLAIESEWLLSPPKKIKPGDFLSSLCSLATEGSPSYNDIAATLDDDRKATPSRQAVAKRTNKPCLQWFKAILLRVMEQRIATTLSEEIQEVGLFETYGRVLVGDSTIIKLPSWLFPEFSGVANATTQVCNARIQAVYDLKAKAFIHFSIDSYSKNDFSAAVDLELRENDLVLRDRGYLLMDEIVRQTIAKALFIYRHKVKSIYLDEDTEEPIELHAELRKHGRLDRHALLNDGSGTRVRIVCEPVDQETADLRRMKAKKENHGHNPSKEVLALMGWTIFITNLEDSVGFEQLLEIYGLRWRIEIIFKAWKSNMSFDVIHRVSSLQLKINLTARLIMITCETNHLYKQCYDAMRAQTGRDLSLLKFTRYLSTNPQRLTRICHWLVNGASKDDSICDALRKYCCYDKRKRLNFHEKCRSIKPS